MLVAPYTKYNLFFSLFPFSRYTQRISIEQKPHIETQRCTQSILKITRDEDKDFPYYFGSSSLSYHFQNSTLPTLLLFNFPSTTTYY